MDVINELLESTNGSAAPEGELFKGIPAFENRYPAFPDQDAYLESWRRFIQQLLDMEKTAETPPLQGKRQEIDILLGRAEQSARLGVSIPVEQFVREHELDMLDRLVFFALFFRSLETDYRRGVTSGELCQLLGADILRRQLELKRRLEETGRLARLGFLQHDGDEIWFQKVYRLSFRQLPVILGEKERPSDAIQVPPDGDDAFEAFLEEVRPLHRFFAKPDSGRRSIWLSRVASTGEWSADESIRQEVLHWIAALRREGVDEFGKLVKESDLDPTSSLVLACLVFLHAEREAPVPVQLIREMAGLFAARGTPVETFLGPDSILAKSGVIELLGDGPLRSRRVRLGRRHRELLVRHEVERRAEENGEEVPGVGDPVEVIETVGRTLDAIVLAPELRARIQFHTRELAASRETLADWGFKNAVSIRPALLFHGPSGTGKTATACAIAEELGVKLLKLRLEQARSRWSGESEKQIARAFRRATEERALLLLDEVDAIAADRDDVPPLDIPFTNLLLQEIESFTGPLILTTNRIGALDPALERRLSAKLEFPPPSRAERRSLWRLYLPEKAPVAPDVDLDALSGQFDLTGAGIERACLEAAIAAAGRGGESRVIGMQDLVAAAQHGSEKWSRRRTVGFREPGARGVSSRKTQTTEYVQETKDRPRQGTRTETVEEDGRL